MNEILYRTGCYYNPITGKMLSDDDTNGYVSSWGRLLREHYVSLGIMEPEEAEEEEIDFSAPEWNNLVLN